MWTSVSGLLVHGEKMNVVGNNISNVNTVGFKGARMDFEDFVSQYIGTAAGVGQVGRGVSVGIVMNDYSQGSFESSTENTDIAVSGNGFFCVVPKNSNTKFYTRAGNFRFDKDGFLVDPHGYVLQGWEIDNKARSLASSSAPTASQGTSIKGTGVPVNVVLETFSCPPKHTNNMRLDINLDSGPGNDKNLNEDYPFFSMLQNWNATPNALGEITPLGSDSYAYASTMEVFDEGGQAHKITIYFDRVEQTLNTNIDGAKTNEIYWEYVVTMDPAEDVRNFGNPPTPAGAVPAQYKGLLMSGTLTFNSSGQIKDMTAYVPTSQNMGDMNAWVEAPLSNNGYPVFAPNFSGRDGASDAWNAARTQINREADGFLIELNLGMRSKATTWSGNAPATLAGWTSPTGSAKPYKVNNGTTPGTVIAGVNPGNADIRGVVTVIDPATGMGRLVYEQASTTLTAPGTLPTPPVGQVYLDSAGTLVDPLATNPAGTYYLYEQKAAADGVLTGEALDSGYVYAQQKATAAGYTTNLMFLGSDGNFYGQDPATGIWSQFSSNTGAGPVTTPVTIPSGVTVSSIADTNKPVASQRGVASGTPVPRYDSTGTPIPGTQTRVYTGMGTNSEVLANASTSYTNNTGNNFYERSRGQDGYTYGELRYVTVSQDGILSGSYSNGVTLELYQIVLYDFPSKQNLRREGGNLFTETRESGVVVSGAPNTGSFGTTHSNAIEQSNVDLAREFVQMITTQRGFQANSKSITTVDTMLETVIQMKR
jgi:flagellar hook protein FlgE